MQYEETKATSSKKNEFHHLNFQQKRPYKKKNIDDSIYIKLKKNTTQLNYGARSQDIGYTLWDVTTWGCAKDFQDTGDILFFDQFQWCSYDSIFGNSSSYVSVIYILLYMGISYNKIITTNIVFV